MSLFEPTSPEDIPNEPYEPAGSSDHEAETRQDESVPEPEAESQNSQPNSEQSDSLSDEILSVKEIIVQVEQNVKSAMDLSSKIAGEVREIHKLYHNEFAGRLKSMQDELERYREAEKGRVFDGILSEVAKLYSDNESISDDTTDPKLKKRIDYILMDIVQILEANGVVEQKSKVGDKRNTRYCQVVERIETDNPELHDTVALSRNTGFYTENRALIKELVDIYLYSEKPAEQSNEI